MSDFPCPRCDAPSIEPEGDLCPECGGHLTEAGCLITALLHTRESGRVYVAFRESDGQRVAIKMRVMPEGAAWFGFDHVQEGMQILEALDHPGLPAFYGVKHDGQGRIFVIREIFDGGSLESRILSGQKPPDLISLLASMLRLLTYLHDRSPAVLHRDIKPSNIFFRTEEDWEPVLVDFDTAMTLRENPGTPGYGAPEALEGKATLASDLYSLGVTMLFALTGQHPSKIEKRGDRFWLPGLTVLEPWPALRQVLMRLVEHNRWGRFQHADDALQILLKHQGTLDQPVIDLIRPPAVGPPRIRRNPMVRLPKWARRSMRGRAHRGDRSRRWAVLGLSVLLVGLVTAIVLVLWFR